MASYAQAGRWGALGAGLRDIGSLLVAGRQEDERAQERQQLMDYQMAAQYATDQLQRGALSPTDLGSATYQAPADAVTRPSGVVISPSLAAEQEAKARSDAARAATQERLYLEDQLANRQDFEYTYGTEGQTDRAIGNFFMQRFSGQLQKPGMTPQAATAIGNALLRAQNQAPKTPEPNYEQAQESVLEVLGRYEVAANGERVYVGPKTGYTEQDILDATRRVMAGGSLPSIPNEASTGMGSPEYWRERSRDYAPVTPTTQYQPPPPYRGPLRPDATAAPTATAKPTGATPPGTTTTPESGAVDDTDKRPDETTEQYVLRLKEQGLGLAQVTQILARQGLLANAPGT